MFNLPRFADKLIELNKTFMDAILKALSKVMSENRRNNVFTLTKQLKMQEYNKDTYFSLNYHTYSFDLDFNVSSSLMSCILNVADRQLT